MSIYNEFILSVQMVSKYKNNIRNNPFSCLKKNVRPFKVKWAHV